MGTHLIVCVLNSLLSIYRRGKQFESMEQKQQKVSTNPFSMSLWRKRVIGAKPHKATPPPRYLTYHELAYRFLSHHDNTVSLYG